MTKKYLLYLARWQLSTPILALVLILLSELPTLWATVIANLIGGLIFFWVDRLIFKNKKIVYCKNCKYEISTAKINEVTGALWCKYKLQPCEPNDYCNKGERRK